MFYIEVEQQFDYIPKGFFEIAEGRNLFLIVDMIHYEEITGMRGLFNAKTSFFKNTISLFKQTEYEDLIMVSPHLCWLNGPDCNVEKREWLFLETEALKKPALLWLWSDLSLSDMQTHLRYFLTARLKNNREALFRFYDPRVAPVFFNMLTKEQRSLFWTPIFQCAYWDVKRLKQVIYRRHVNV